MQFITRPAPEASRDETHRERLKKFKVANVKQRALSVDDVRARLGCLGIVREKSIHVVGRGLSLHCIFPALDGRQEHERQRNVR